MRDWTWAFALYVLVFLFVSWAHWDYPLPWHADEWDSLTKAHRLVNGVPVVSDNELWYGQAEDLFLSVLYFLGLDVPRLFWLLPGLIAGVSAFILFFLLRPFGRLAALAGIVGFATLPSNSNILGIWFFVPMSLAIPFIFGIWLAFQRKAWRTMIFLFIILCFVHPLSAILMAFTLAVLYGGRWRQVPWHVYACGLLLLAVFTFWKWEWFSLLFSVSEKGYNPFDAGLSVALYGIVPFLLALWGLRKWKELRIVTVWTVIAGIVLLLHFLGFGVLSEARTLYSLMIGMTVFTGAGVVSRHRALGVVLVIVLLLSGLVRWSDVPAETLPYRYVSVGEYDFIRQMGSLPADTVLAPLAWSPVVEAVSGHVPVACRRYYRCLNSDNFVDSLRTKLTFDFESVGCGEKFSILGKFRWLGGGAYSPRYVISSSLADCSWSKRLFRIKEGPLTLYDAWNLRDYLRFIHR